MIHCVSPRRPCGFKADSKGRLPRRIEARRRGDWSVARIEQSEIRVYRMPPVPAFALLKPGYG